MNNENFKELIKGYLDDTISVQQAESLVSLMKEPGNHLLLKQSIEEAMAGKSYTGLANKERSDIIFQNVMKEVYSIKPQRSFFQSWKKIAAAAILILLATGSYFIFSKKNKKGAELASQEERFKNDVVAPQSNKATLQLADGSVIVLDDVENGHLAIGNQQSAIGNDATVLKQGDLISYQSAVVRPQSAVVYNSLNNPKGSKPMQLKLADGSMVWLDAATKITYPTTFPGKERKLTIEGQAYFEIAHDASKPFKVNIPGRGEVEVLGTHFNVDSYNDNSETKVTLLEGSVKVSQLAARNSQLLFPGQQASIGSEIRINKNVNLDEIMSWKNGKFIFNGSDIKTLMSQMARWYDLDIAYNDVIKEKFHLELSRNTNVTTILKILETTGAVHFTIEGKKITVNK